MVFVGGLLQLRFLPSPDPVAGYEWEYRLEGAAYQSGGVIDADIRDASDLVFADFTPIAFAIYDFRVRALGDRASSYGSGGSVSDWIEVAGILASGPDATLPVPVDGQATAGDGQIEVSFRAPNSGRVEGIEFWGSDVDDDAEAALLDTRFGAANLVQSITEAGLGPGVTRFHFARTRGGGGAVSAFTAAVSATTFGPALLTSEGQIFLTSTGATFRVGAA